MRRISVCCFVSLLIIFPVSFVFAQTRGGELENVVGPNVTVGKQWAVFIAIDKYQEWGPLNNPVRDAKEIRDILLERYYIDEVRELYDLEATGVKIRQFFVSLRSQVSKDDSVFVFYAGHGYTDSHTNTGSWIPTDGGWDTMAQTNWLPNIQIRNLLAQLPAKHVFLISDSCFSGDILDTNRGAPSQIDSNYYRQAYAKVSRQVMTSGASESVPDASEFALRLKSSLRRAEGPAIDPEYLFTLVREVKSTQPMLGVISGSEHQRGGSFLFFRKKSPPPLTEKPALAEKPALDSNAMREMFNGDWIGTDTRLQINGDRIIQYFKNEDGTWRPISPEKQYFLYSRNNLVYIWLNKGGVWSESQVFSLSNINSNALDLVWNRHVNNMANNEDNDVWNVNDHQTLFRAGTAQNLSSAPLSQKNNQTIPAQFQGNWIGEVNVKERDASIKIRLVVTANKVTQFFQDDDGSWDEVVPASSNFDFDRNNLVYVWVNKGGIWSETQAYSLSVVNNKTLNVVWSRHVNNYYKDEIVNQAWHIGGEGMIGK